MGVVHHSNYVNYYEVARTEMMRERGISYKEMEQRGVMLPVREVNMKSIMGVMSLGVPTKATVEIVAEGDDEKDVIASIAKVIKEQKVAE